MSGTSKYDLLLKEINEIEKYVHTFVSKNQELQKEKNELEEKVAKLNNDNKILISKINELEKKANSAEVNITSILSKKKLNVNERENLKNQIDELIEKIDYHIQSL